MLVMTKIHFCAFSAFFRTMLTNAMKELITAVRTLIASTLREVTLVHAEMVSLNPLMVQMTVQFVKVRQLLLLRNQSTE